MADQSEAPKPKVFISYSRHDSSPLAEELAAGLRLTGFDAYLDRLDIAAGEDWEKRLATLIESADTVVFILSPESVKSERCSWEVETATRLSKRVLPVVGAPIDDADVPAALRRLNYIFFRAGQSFVQPLSEVADALRIDLDWIREHTRLAEMAARWDLRERGDALLLRGEELQRARAWMAARRPGAPEVTDLQRALIAASTDAETALSNKERQQLEAMAKAQAEQATALSERESAVRKLRRRTLMLNGAILFVLAVAGFAGWRSVEEEKRVRAAELNAIQKAIEKEAARTDIEGQAVAYAASPGQPAMDSVDGGKNSPYTKFLLEEVADENASLQLALYKANRKVLASTRNEQRPYLASDLGGDIYLKRTPAGRRCEAVLVSVDTFGTVRDVPKMPNVVNDARDWERFLAAQSFRTQRLENPTRELVLGVLRAVDLAADVLPIATALKLPETTKPRAVQANTCLIFFFSGAGFEYQGQQYLFAADTGIANRDAIEKTAIKVRDLQAMARSKAAASVLILDTNFVPLAIP